MEEEKSESRKGKENDVTGQGLFPPAADADSCGSKSYRKFAATEYTARTFPSIALIPLEVYIKSFPASPGELCILIARSLFCKRPTTLCLPCDPLINQAVANPPSLRLILSIAPRP
ncbi:uncharacterized protein TrAtP1_004722 [Trichoderma atroviride]|uniref:uncharacterized protein n=1 Tax=Hypocrea atroviridis TaxID=63577 RepID=UPI00331A03A5|nr:hypothetical protein TrAtP1_004722 [Trichoderma atroviride]